LGLELRDIVLRDADILLNTTLTTHDFRIEIGLLQAKRLSSAQSDLLLGMALILPGFVWSACVHST
jgi:hypothetical protein